MSGLNGGLNGGSSVDSALSDLLDRGRGGIACDIVIAGNRINMPEARRRAAIRSMVDGLFLHEHIQVTTDARAKVAQSEAEKLIGIAIRGATDAPRRICAPSWTTTTPPSKVLALARRGRFSLDEKIPTNEERADQGKFPLSAEARKLQGRPARRVARKTCSA